MYRTSKALRLLQLSPGEGGPGIINESDLYDAPSSVQAALQDFGAPASLSEHITDEAREGDLYAGSNPRTLSPLASAVRASPSHINESLAISPKLKEGSAFDPVAGFEVWEAHPQLGTPVVSLSLLGGLDAPVAISAFAPDAFIMAVPPQTSTVDIGYWPEGDPDYLLTDWEPLSDPDITFLWRHYVGTDSLGIDGFTLRGSFRKLRKILLSPLDAMSFIVGRALFIDTRRRSRLEKDPTRVARLARQERRGSQAINIENANVADVSDAEGRRAAVVAVHGTMSCSVSMANAISDIISSVVVAGTPVLRYEHDTWEGVSKNAIDLEAHIRRLRLDRLLVIAHSRGGLVSAESVDRLAGFLSRFEVLALGTPFSGTPIADATSDRFSAAYAVMDQLNIDAYTRIFGLMYNGSVPPGISDMQTGSGYIRATDFRAVPSSIGFGGDVNPSAPVRQHGLAILWHTVLKGFARGVFSNTRNDLVVPQESTFARMARTIPLGCDHFSYMSEEEVRRGVLAAYTRLIS